MMKLPVWLNPVARTLRSDFDLQRRERVAHISLTLAAVTDATRLFDELVEKRLDTLEVNIHYQDKGIEIMEVLLDSLDEALLEEEADDPQYQGK